MGIELGSIGSAVGSVAFGVSVGVGNVASGIGNGIEGGLGGAALVSGLEFSAPAFGAAPLVGEISAASFCEGPMPVNAVGGFEPTGASLEGLEPMGKIDLGTLDLKGGSNQPGFNLAGEILFQAEPELNEASVLAEAESVLTMGRIEPLTETSIAEEVTNPVNIEPEINYVFPDVLVAEEHKSYLAEPLVHPELPTWEVIAPQVGIAAAPVYDNYLYDRTSNWYEPYGHPLTQPSAIQSSASTLLNPVLSPALETVTKTATKTENQISAAVAPSILPQPASEAEEMAEIVEEKVERQEPEEVLEEEKVKERKIIVEDREVTAQRTLDIKVVAVKKAQELAIKLGLKKIPGRFIALFAPREYAGVRSQLIKEKGPDGSYEETIDVLAGAGEFESVTAAKEKVDQVIAEKKPGKYGKNGVQLASEHVARIFKYRLFKPMQIHTEVVKRVVKKKVQQSSRNLLPLSVATEKPRKEPNIAAFPRLAEALQQAA